MPGNAAFGSPLFRRAAPADLPAVTALWRRVFGDDEAFVSASLARFVGAGNQLLAVDGAGRAVAIGSAVPCTLAGNEGIYLYALATDEAARGAGVMTGLMAFAEGEAAAGGARFSALIPATLPLFDYYRRRGYDVDVPLRRLVYSGGGGAAGGSPSVAPNAETVMELRRRFLPGPVIGFGASRFAMVAEDLAGSGVRLAVGPGAYCLWMERENSVLVAELGAESDGDAAALLEGILAKAGQREAAVTLSAASTLFAGQGEVRPFALLKWLGPPQKLAERPYLRFGFEELDG